MAAYAQDVRYTAIHQKQPSSYLELSVQSDFKIEMARLTPNRSLQNLIYLIVNYASRTKESLIVIRVTGRFKYGSIWATWSASDKERTFVIHIQRLIGLLLTLI